MWKFPNERGEKKFVTGEWVLGMTAMEGNKRKMEKKPGKEEPVVRGLPF